MFNVNCVPFLIGSCSSETGFNSVYHIDKGKRNSIANILENQMERAEKRDYVVKLVLRLLKKKRIVLL